MKIFLKILSSYLILILLTIAVLDFFLMPRITRMMTDRIEDEMSGMARMMALMPRERIAGGVHGLSEELNVRITMIDAAGHVLVESDTERNRMDNHLSRPEIVQAKKQGQGKASRFSTTLQESMLYVAVPVEENGQIKGYVRLSRPLVMVRKSIDHLNWALYMTLYIITIPSLILSLIFSRKICSRIVDEGRKRSGTIGK